MRKRKFRGKMSKVTRVPKRRKFASVVNPQLITLRDLQYFDKDIAQTVAATTATQTLLFIPTVGTGATNRYGDKTVIKRISWNFFVNDAGSAAAFRAILYYDRQPNGSAPVAPDPLTANGAHTFKNPDLRHRYLILRDWTINPLPSTGLANEKRDFIQKGTLTCDLPSIYTASAGAIADVATGSLYLYLYNASGSSVGVAGSIRCLFQS